MQENSFMQEKWGPASTVSRGIQRLQQVNTFEHEHQGGRQQ